MFIVYSTVTAAPPPTHLELADCIWSSKAVDIALKVWDGMATAE